VGERTVGGGRRVGIGAAIVLVLAIAAVSVGVGVVRSASAPVEEVAVAAVTPVPPAELYVHVFGAVTAPGLYRLAEGARVVDAVAAAGGMTADADAAGVNLARPVADGEQLRVPAVGEAPPPPAPEAGGAVGPGAAGALVDLNTADAATLDTLPRVGPTTAQRIIAWREENGAFTSVEDLLAVPGIGEKMLATLRELVTV
jgi:competence protein ComEA